MASEQRGFVFAVTFIILFSVLYSTIPAGLQGPEETPDMVIPVNPTLVTDFSSTARYNKGNFTVVSGPILHFVYTLGGRDWINFFDGSATFYLDAKVYVLGLWLGQTESVKCIAPDGTDRGYGLSLTEITADATDGEVRYNLLFTGSGLSAGGLVFYWNTTTYTSASSAWTASALWILHGIGIQDTAAANIGSLLIQLLFLQLPDVPLLVNILIITPIWASILYVIWYIIKEMIPFL